MSAVLKSTLLALEALERDPRRYAGDPAVDQFRRECERDRELRARLRHEREDEPRERSWEDAMEDECGYHGDRR